MRWNERDETDAGRRVVNAWRGGQRTAKLKVTRRGVVVGGVGGGAEQMAFRGGWIPRFLIGWWLDR